MLQSFRTRITTGTTARLEELQWWTGCHWNFQKPEWFLELLNINLKIADRAVFWRLNRWILSGGYKARQAIRYGSYCWQWLTASEKFSPRMPSHSKNHSRIQSPAEETPSRRDGNESLMVNEIRIQRQLKFAITTCRSLPSSGSRRLRVVLPNSELFNWVIGVLAPNRFSCPGQFAKQYEVDHHRWPH